MDEPETAPRRPCVRPVTVVAGALILALGAGVAALSVQVRRLRAERDQLSALLYRERSSHQLQAQVYTLRQQLEQLQARDRAVDPPR